MRHPGRLTGPNVFAALRPTVDELAEFERREAIAPLDEEGCPAWSFDGEPLTARERRWLELYRKLENSGGSPRRMDGADQ
ncbi:hypothetical protein [Bradyrhizobium tunisiense]|uniref:hypothetical protein n=1 Tax=Bradyrhizobium tunisiense TaxID=3278709 RepID=UPI0035E1910D